MQIHTDNQTFTVKIENNTVLLNDVAFEGDIQRINTNEFHVLHHNKSYRVEIVKSDYPNKEFEILINGKKVTLKAKDRMDLLLESMGLENATAAKVSDLKAPMPGLVIDVMTKVGDKVKKGTPLLILEAMKMENVLKATGEGTIKHVAINKGQNVEKGAMLIEFE